MEGKSSKFITHCEQTLKEGESNASGDIATGSRRR